MKILSNLAIAKVQRVFKKIGKVSTIKIITRTTATIMDKSIVTPSF